MSKQLLLFPEWWHNPDLWRDRHTHSDIHRPTEDIALENIFTQACVINGDYRVHLNAFETEVLDTFVYFKKLRSGYPDSHYRTQTAIKLRMAEFQVRDVLDLVDHIKRNADRVQSFTVLPNTLDGVA